MNKLTMENEYLINIKRKIIFYKKNIIFLKKLLHEGSKKRDINLIDELKVLEKDLNNLETILNSRDNKNSIVSQENNVGYFDVFNKQFLDLLILVRWNNWSEKHIKLRALCNKTSPIKFYERESYKILLNMFDEIC